MHPDPTVLLITGGRLGEPLVTLHASRELAEQALGRKARELLQEQLEFVPMWAQEGADHRALVDGLYGLGWRVLLEEREVKGADDWQPPNPAAACDGPCCG